MKIRYSVARLPSVSRSLSRLSPCLFAAVWLLATAGALAADETPSASGFHERSIYIPYEDLKKTFERDGRGVFLPYEKFMFLWQAARQAEADVDEAAAPPVAHLLKEVVGQARVGAEVVSATVEIRIALLTKGWHRVHLGLGDVAISRAEIDGQAATLLTVDGGFALLAENPDTTPRELSLALEFGKTYDKTPGRNRVDFAAPQAPISRWEVVVPEAGVEVDIQPMVARTEPAPDPAGGESTRLLAVVGATPRIRIQWTPKVEGAKGLAAMATVQTEQQLWIDEGATRTRATVTYAISRAEIAELSLRVPSGQRIVNLFDANLRQWSVTETDAGQVVTATLFEPARERQTLVVELERFADEPLVSAPVIEALDVGRQRGVVTVHVAPGLRAEATRREGLMQLDASELPAHLRRQTWAFSYRYASLPFGLDLSVEKIEPRITVDTVSVVRLLPESLTSETTFVYDIQRAGVFQLVLKIPEGVEIRGIQGFSPVDGNPAEVDAHRRSSDTPDEVVVTLGRQALGATGLLVSLERRLDEANLLAPTGEPASVPVPFPQAAGAVVREEGRLLVHAPESLRVTVEHHAAMRAIPLPRSEPPSETQRRLATDAQPVLAFAYTEPDARLRLGAERRRPQITVSQLLAVRIEAGVAKYQATFDYTVLYSPVKSLALALPSELSDDLRLITPGLRHQPAAMDERSALPEGDTAWEIVGEREFSGRQRVTLTWETRLERLDIGASVELAVPRLRPLGVDRAWGQVVLAKAESLDVAPVEGYSGLRPIDHVHELIAGGDVRDAARAFEFHGAWRLRIRATRYETKDVKATSIERALIRSVHTRGEVVSVQALYRMRSARQRLTIKLPAEVEFDTQPLRLNGRPVALETGADGMHYAPLVNQSPDVPFLLELRYLVKRRGLRVSIPEFPLAPAIQRVYLSVHLPREMAYLGSVGPWNDEFIWRVQGFSTGPRGNQSDAALLAWVAEGVAVDHASLAAFATDGRQLLFSTLHPPGGRASDLRIVSWRRYGLDAILIVGGVAIGLALLRQPFGTRLVVVAGIAVALLLTAVFLPSFARAVVTNGTVAGAMVVAVIWALWHLLVERPRDPLVQAVATARETLRHVRLPAPSPPPPIPPPAGDKPAAGEAPRTEGGDQ